MIELGKFGSVMAVPAWLVEVLIGTSVSELVLAARGHIRP